MNISHELRKRIVSQANAIEREISALEEEYGVKRRSRKNLHWRDLCVDTKPPPPHMKFKSTPPAYGVDIVGKEIWSIQLRFQFSKRMPLPLRELAVELFHLRRLVEEVLTSTDPIYASAVTESVMHSKRKISELRRYNRNQLSSGEIFDILYREELAADPGVPIKVLASNFANPDFFENAQRKYLGSVMLKAHRSKKIKISTSLHYWVSEKVKKSKSKKSFFNEIGGTRKAMNLPFDW